MKSKAATNLQTQFERLIEQLRVQFPDARVELTSFSSGAQMLDFVCEKRFWVFAYSPSHAEFGVDEVKEENAFDTGYEHVFQDFEAGKRKLLELISDGSSKAQQP